MEFLHFTQALPIHTSRFDQVRYAIRVHKNTKDLSVAIPYMRNFFVPYIGNNVKNFLI